jgi:rhodanese-related sulfurtransferase
MDFIAENSMWIMLAFISGGMLIIPMIRGGGAGSVSVTEATLLLNRQDAIVLDVRETGEWDAGHITNARHIALAQLDKRLSELEKFKERPIIVCCASGNRSSSACGSLKRAGFEKVFNLAGGLGAWRDAGLPVTTKH